MSDEPILKEKEKAANEFNNKKAESFILKRLSVVNTMTELADLLNILSINQPFMEHLNLLKINYSQLIETFRSLAKNVSEENQDPKFAANEVPEFLRLLVSNVVKNELSLIKRRKLEEFEKQNNFNKLKDILNGENFSNIHLRNALDILKNLGEYKGSSTYSMQELHTAVMEVLREVETTQKTVLQDEISSKLQEKLPTLKGKALVFFSKAITLYVSRLKRGFTQPIE